MKMWRQPDRLWMSLNRSPVKMRTDVSVITGSPGRPELSKGVFRQGLKQESATGRARSGLLNRWMRSAGEKTEPCKPEKLYLTYLSNLQTHVDYTLNPCPYLLFYLYPALPHCGDAGGGDSGKIGQIQKNT